MAAAALQFIPVAGVPLVGPGDDLPALLTAALKAPDFSPAAGDLLGFA
jgi:F420-0:gamma-glutamyl ligase